MLEFKTPYTLDKVVRLIITLGVFVLIFLMFRRLSAVLTPFFVGWFIAYLLHPIVKFFQYKLKFKSRILSLVITLFLFLGSITGVIILLIPQITKEIKKVSLLIRDFAQNFNYDTLLPIPLQEAIKEYFASFDVVEAINNPNIMEIVRKAAPQVLEIFNNSLNFIFGFIVILIVLLYIIFILKDYEKITNAIPTIIPEDYRDIVMEIFGDIQDGMNRYFRGQALIALIIGILYTTGFIIIGLPMAIVFGILVGILNLVPYLQTVAIVPGMLLFVLKASEPGHTLGGVLFSVLIVFVIVQSFQDLFLVPKIMGRVTGLKPAVIILALSVWGSLMGIIGMIIALPLTTLIISYYKRWILRNERDNKERDDLIAEIADIKVKSSAKKKE